MIQTERHKLKVAVYVMFIKDDKILLSRRFNTGWQDGNYTLPSGHLDPHETISRAAIREMQEEIGITLHQEDIKFVQVVHHSFEYIDFYFLAKSWTGEPKNLELDKCDDLIWAPINQLPDNMILSVRYAIEQYQKGISFSEFGNEG